MFDPVANVLKNATVTQRALGLQPIDLLYIVALDGESAMSELDDRIVRYIMDTRAPRPDTPIMVRHTARLTAPLKSFFEVAPLIRHLRSLLLRSRPLVPTDLALSGEAARDQDTTVSIDSVRVTKVRTELNQLGNDLSAAAINAPVDDAIDDIVELFARAAQFGIQQIGWGFIYEWRRRAFSDALGRVSSIIERWEDRLTAFDAGLTEYDALPAETPDDERYAALGRLDLLVAAAALSPRPATPALYRVALPQRRAAFDTKRLQLRGLLLTGETRLGALLTLIGGALPLTQFDLTPITLDDLVAESAKFIDICVRASWRCRPKWLID